MWGKNPTYSKCPRNDCKFYNCKPDTCPCDTCSCNSSSDTLGRSFRYEHKEDQKCERNSQQKPSMPDSST